jgi:myo-inositol catabolism protein IolS
MAIDANASSNRGSTPELGLGCWPLGGDQWGVQDRQQSIATIRAALDAGIRHFDTAQGYGRGQGEEILGEALAGHRDRVFIATKLFYLPKDKVESAIAAALKRLRTDHIDLLYIHWPKKNGDLAGMMEAFERARSAGLIRKIGVSNFSVGQMEEVMRAGTLDAVQLCYNLLWRREERAVIPFCKNNGIEIVTYSSLAEGILTGKFGTTADFPKGDHRKQTVLFEPDVWPLVFPAVWELKLIAEGIGRPLAHCAIRWLLDRPGVTTVLAGARTPRQVEENRKALDGEIPSVLLQMMTAVSDRLAPKLPDAGNIFRWYP